MFERFSRSWALLKASADVLRKKPLATLRAE